MLQYNHAALVGRPTHAIETRRAGGSEVGNFQVAVKRTWQDQERNRQESTDFIQCEIWGKMARALAANSVKGKLLLLEGRQKAEEWDNNGVRERRQVMLVERWQYAEPKRSEMTDRTAQASADDRATMDPVG
jgi:single-strand DNA-binding protein